jgi:hypothetical protein
MKMYMIDVGEDLWPGRKSFPAAGELVRHTRNTTIVTVDLLVGKRGMGSEHRVEWCQGVKLEADDRAIEAETNIGSTDGAQRG